MAHKGWDIPLQLGNAEQLPYEDNSFDGVFHLGGINFFDDKKKAIEEMIRVAEPGTRILICDENEKGAQAYERFLPSFKKMAGEQRPAVVPPVDLLPPAMLQARFLMFGKAGCTALNFESLNARRLYETGCFPRSSCHCYGRLGWDRQGAGAAAGGTGGKRGDRSPARERLEQVAAECRALGGEALVVPTDVSVEDQCKALVEKTIATFGKLDVLINNAGLATSALFDEFPDLRLFRYTVEVNFYGGVNCSYYALPYLKQSRGGIVAISSVGGKAAIPYNTPYISSKYAMHGFYDALRMELAQHGVSVTVVCPWWVVTEFHEAQTE